MHLIKDKGINTFSVAFFFVTHRLYHEAVAANEVF